MNMMKTTTLAVALFLLASVHTSHAADVDYFTRGVGKYDKNDLPGGLADFAKAIETRPDNAEALEKRGDVKYYQGDYEGAIADYTKAIALKPDFTAAFHDRGYTKVDTGDLNGALADFNRAIELKADDADAYGIGAW
jgi:tetratricopeptide (TPR) repeat protein